MDRTIRKLNLQSMQKKITISIHTTFCEKVGSKSKDLHVLILQMETTIKGK